MLTKVFVRLQALVDLIPVDSTIIDLGADHGFLTLLYLQQNPHGFAYVTDIKEAPLQNAMTNFTKYHLNPNQYRLIKADGFQNWNAPNATVAVLAGMGAVLITNILHHCPAQITTLLLATATKPSLIRKFFVNQNWKIITDKIVWENNVFYFLFQVVRHPRKLQLTSYQITFGVFYYKFLQDRWFRTYLWEQKMHYESILSQIKPASIASQKFSVKIKAINDLLTRNNDA